MVLLCALAYGWLTDDMLGFNSERLLKKRCKDEDFFVEVQQKLTFSLSTLIRVNTIAINDQ